MTQRSIADQFAEKLKAAEQSKDFRDLVALFHEDAEISNVTNHIDSNHERDQHAEPATYWSHYLAAFVWVKSTLRRTPIDDGHTAVLEWNSQAELSTGLPVHYSGVSILDYDDGKIRSLRIYYDSAALVPHSARAMNSISQTAGLPPITNQATS